MCNLETDRLCLRKTTADDWERYHALNSNADVLRYCFDVPTDKEIRKEFDIRIQPWNLSSEHWLNLTIFEKDKDDVIGMTGLRNANSAAEVGFLFLPQYQGLGYGTESLKALKEYAISLGIRELFARIVKGNDASIRLVEKCGFSFYAERENVVRINGIYHNGLIYKWRHEP